MKKTIGILFSVTIILFALFGCDFIPNKSQYPVPDKIDSIDKDTVLVDIITFIRGNALCRYNFNDKDFFDSYYYNNKNKTHYFFVCKWSGRLFMMNHSFEGYGGSFKINEKHTVFGFGYIFKTIRDLGDSCVRQGREMFNEMVTTGEVKPEHNWVDYPIPYNIDTTLHFKHIIIK